MLSATVMEIPPAFLTYAEASLYADLSQSTVRRLVDAGKVPPPVNLRERAPVFYLPKLERWAADRVAQRDAC